MAPKLKPQLSLLLLLLFSVCILSSVSSPVDEKDDGPPTDTVFEILPKFGLPSGLLPDAVKSYFLSSDEDGGSFVVELEKPCYIHFDYLVYYEKRITGMLKYGSITNLHGIQVQRLLFWFDVDDITVDLPPSDSIYFQVGFINKKLDIDQFKTVHSCRDKLSTTASSAHQSFKFNQYPISQLPTSSDGTQMLVTE